LVMRLGTGGVGGAGEIASVAFADMLRCLLNQLASLNFARNLKD
jgi:hypothetical protein